MSEQRFYCEVHEVSHEEGQCDFCNFVVANDKSLEAAKEVAYARHAQNAVNSGIRLQRRQEYDAARVASEQD